MSTVEYELDLQRAQATIPRPATEQINELDASHIIHSSFGSGQSEVEQTPLPPTDGGRAAWLVLAGCSIIQTPVWGFSLAFGVFQEFYTKDSGLKGNKSGIAIIGTTFTGILYLTSPVLFGVLTRWPGIRSICGPIGLLINIISLLLSSFATEVWQLIATQGVLCGLGSGLLFAPTTLYLDEWFVRKKGLAIGIMWAGKSISGVVLPFIMDVSLRKFGPRTTLQGWTVATLLMTAPLLHFLRPRIPVARSSSARRLDLSFLRLSSFWMLQAGNIMQSLGYFLPTAYLSAYTVDQLHLSSTIGTLLLSILNGTSVFGGIVIGVVSDHFHVTNAILVSTLGSTAAIFFLWGFSSHVAVLSIFVIVYGFFAGGYSTTWSGALMELKRESPASDTGFMFGLLSGGRGIGNVISGPLSVALMTNAGWLDLENTGGYSSKYGPMIIFTGVTALLGGWSWIWRYLKTHC
ncbi:putative MFS monocarboxylate transporter [Patellaria atrata CBS 101060]|uniref:MFS monocarboxylate transporter n=1 Tax=Patellaria atrata CBS 101060 TaxID=1346257 RepID=A0A9P4SHD6_9PEZI|nr:putative MFS monocarboxylate transporter [Patellaria atrata CBS 101060]